jgi:hypothetical protein
MKNKAVKVLPSPFIAIGIATFVLFSYGLLIFSFLYPTDEDYLPLLYSILTFFLGIFPTIIVIGLSYRGYYSVITIDEKGIRRALFGAFMKVEMTWEEIKYIKRIWRVVDNIFVSTKEENKAMTFEQAIKRRDIIQIAISKKVLKAIRQYIDLPIIGLPEEQVQSIISDKPKKDKKA